MATNTPNAGEAVPNSAGTDRPRLEAPAGACDCHMHIYDAERFPPARPGSRMQANAGVADYQRLQRRIGTTRTVIVQPAAYGTDNAVTLDAIARLGNARGVAVVFPDVSDGELRTLHAGGVRGIRFTVFDPATAVTRIDMIEPLARRMADIGWHVQIHMRGDQIVANADLLRRLPSTIVIDHMGRVPLSESTSHAAFKVVRALIDKGNTWVKLSGAYQDTKVGPPTYADATALARGYVEAAPERLVWGSDWRTHPARTQGRAGRGQAALACACDLAAFQFQGSSSAMRLAG